ncbi:MAG TPA: hypothetical protein VNP73_01555 [Actinomycetota bacterium]|nr:hypothetical protein [Actinomycetota bacterium]
MLGRTVDAIRIGVATGIVVGVVGLSFVSAAGAEPIQADDPEFSPTIEWTFCDEEPIDACEPGYGAGENPRLDIVVEQDEGERDFSDLKVRFPSGYYLAPDGAIADGSLLGSADVEIGSGPGCAGGEGKAPFTAEDLSVREQGRTEKEIKRGVKSVWVIEVLPNSNIVLKTFGSRSRGIKIDHIIPANDFLCPPLRVEVNYQAQSEDGAAIFRNPEAPGTYTFKALFVSEGDDPMLQRRAQEVTIGN